MKTKFCTKSKKDSCRRAPAAPPAISKAGFTRSTRGSATALLLHLTTTCIILKYFHWPLRNSISLKKKNPKPWKNCSLLLSLPRVIHCALGSLPPQPKSTFPPFNISCHPRLPDTAEPWSVHSGKLHSIAFIQNLWKLWHAQDFRSVACLMQTKVR